jgi:transketolase
MSVRLVSLHTVKPLDEPLLDESFLDSTLVVTLEEHSIVGGLGGAVAEWLTDHGPHGAKLLRMGTPDRFLHPVGTQDCTRESVGLDVETITRRILRQLPEDNIPR